MNIPTQTVERVIVSASNTPYRLTGKVPVVLMKEIMQECLQSRLTGMVYEGEKCNETAKYLSDMIRDRFKSLQNAPIPEFDRYKFVVQVIIGERRDQGIKSIFPQDSSFSQINDF